MQSSKATCWTNFFATIDKRGLDHLVSLAKAEQDAATRGNRLGTLMGTYTVQQHLQRKGPADLSMRIAQDEQNPVARRRYLEIQERG